METRKFKIESHWLLEDIKPEIDKVRIIVFDKKIKQKLYGEACFKDEELALLRKVTGALEVAAIDSWKDSSDKFLFSMICQEYAEILQIFPLPDESLSRMKFVLKLIAFSYLGEKWEDGRRFLIERETAWKIIHNESAQDWDIQLFNNCYRATLYLVRKQNWEDLSCAMEIISNLRNSQKEYEEKYFSNIENQFKVGAAFELAAFYHLAKAIELVAGFNLNGEPSSTKLIAEIDFHFEKGIDCCRAANNVEYELLLRILQEMFKKMIYNSIWRISEKINSRVTKFVKHVTRIDKPIFELLYPQRSSILEQGLLDPAHRAIVVNLPTSSGKTLIAEFRILQALNQFSDERGWIAYIAPTRALVNQITARLKRDLNPLGIKVEKMSGALELDAFEEEMISQKNAFDILVITPEKLNLLIKQKIESELIRPLVLVIADEVQNLEDEDRGLNLEILLSTVQNDCKKANFLLLTPFVPNGDAIAKWLDPDNPKSISLEFDWSPNDKVVGFLGYQGKGKKWKTFYQPLINLHDSIDLKEKFIIGENADEDFPAGKLKTKYILSAVIADQMQKTGNNLVIGRTLEDCWKIAEILYERFPDKVTGPNIELVQKYIAAELGENFPLIQYLGKGIGVHHSGLPDEIKFLIEDLMERGELKVLVATTTIAHGINFPVSGIFMSSYSYPYKATMPTRDFWNLAGRAGRVDHGKLGIVGLAISNTHDAAKAARFLQEKTKDLASTLTQMVEQAVELGDELNLEKLAYLPQWSAFLQYIAHMYKQADDIDQFISESEITLRRTYGYSLLNEKQKKVLLEAVKSYARKLDGKPQLATLSEMTGFSPETINTTIAKVRDLGITQADWNSSRLFSDNSNSLKDLIGVMLTIPEISKSLKDVNVPGEKYTQQTIAQLINDWISGKDLADITRHFWHEENEGNLSKCISILYSKIVNSATWGLASLQKLPTSGIDFDSLSEEDSRRLKNIPAMIYYGVNTDEGILMRTNNVSRSVAKQLGKLFKSQNNDIYTSNTEMVTKWLDNLNEEEWMVSDKTSITGAEYKKIWKRISGID